MTDLYNCVVSKKTLYTFSIPLQQRYIEGLFTGGVCTTLHKQSTREHKNTAINTSPATNRSCHSKQTIAEHQTCQRVVFGGYPSPTCVRNDFPAASR